MVEVAMLRRGSREKEGRDGQGIGGGQATGRCGWAGKRSVERKDFKVDSPVMAIPHGKIKKYIPGCRTGASMNTVP